MFSKNWKERLSAYQELNEAYVQEGGRVFQRDHALFGVAQQFDRFLEETNPNIMESAVTAILSWITQPLGPNIERTWSFHSLVKSLLQKTLVLTQRPSLVEKGTSLLSQLFVCFYQNDLDSFFQLVQDSLIHSKAKLQQAALLFLPRLIPQTDLPTHSALMQQLMKLSNGTNTLTKKLCLDFHLAMLRHHGASYLTSAKPYILASHLNILAKQAQPQHSSEPHYE